MYILLLYSSAQAGDSMTVQRGKTDNSSGEGTSSNTDGSQQETEGGEPQDDVTIADDATLRMKKEIGLFSGMAFIVGSIIGSGIFISPRGVLEGTGSVGASLLVWLACGLISMAAGLCYTELGTMIPLSGAEFSYLKESLGSFPAFLSVWIDIVLSRTSSQAVLALTFSKYALAPMFDVCGPPEYLLKMTASAVILTVAIVNCKSAALATRVQVIFTLIKLSALVIIIIGGIVKLAQGNTQYLSTGFEGSDTNPSAIAQAFYNGLWAYTGWSSLNYLTEELINPNVNLPRAILFSVPLVIVVYLLTNISYFTVLSKEMLLDAPAIAVSWGDHVLGPVSTVIPLAVACSTFGTLNSSCFSGARMSYVAGREGHFPNVLSYIHVHQLTPWCSLIFTTVVALGMVIPGDLGILINFISFTSWLIYGLTFGGLIVMRFTRKDWERPYKVPIVIPAVLVLVCAYLVMAPVIQNPQIEFLYAILFVFSGLFYYVPFVYFKLRMSCMDPLIMWAQLYLQVAPSKVKP
ncbi:b(0,+)-type amino acid transporter 1-like [Liolophura sinensis]|uniref:b(0,+)-type amino acid transporter 1-like n=1 Tax=Liolophura sinensis TaxID=3198878 RepID=UPI0031585072